MDTAMIIGLIVAVIGIILIPISFREDIREYGLFGPKLPHRLPKKQKSWGEGRKLNFNPTNQTTQNFCLK
jgi:hypothetical protein